MTKQEEEKREEVKKPKKVFLSDTDETKLPNQPLEKVFTKNMP